MKTKELVLAMFCALAPVACSAQKNASLQSNSGASANTATQEPAPEVTLECRKNVSLFYEAAKNKQFAEALAPWEAAYAECPNASKNIYIKGVDIIEWQIANAKSEQEKNELRQKLMKLYDDRIRWFGNDAKTPTPYILGDKALDYIKYFPEDKLKEQAYEWLKQSVNGMGAKSKIMVLTNLVVVSQGLYKENPAHAEQFIADYQLASDYLSQQAADTKNKNQAAAQQQKDYIDNLFAVSGAADCGKLDELYAKTVNDNLENKDMLAKIIALYRRVRCTESEVYFLAAENAHRLEPNAETAAGCAAMSAKRGNIELAIDYYNQAFELAQTADDKADYLYNNAVYSLNLKKLQDARSYARRSLEQKADQGRCYIIIGMAYGQAKPFDNDYLNQTVFWAAVDKFQQAKRVDATVAETANDLIKSYSQHFVSLDVLQDLRGKVFDANASDGDSYHIGGWINETTTIRTRK